MNIYVVLILRLVHIFAGVLWVGAAILYFFYIGPTVKDIGPAGGKFMVDFIERRRYPVFMAVVSTLTIVSGVPLFLNTSGGLQSSWMRSGPGLGFTIGSVVPLAVYVIGFLMIKPRAERMGSLSEEIGISGGAPTDIQAAELSKLESESTKIELVEFILLSVSMITMATARYWNF
jgi:uncharacterized membrane protein